MRKPLWLVLLIVTLLVASCGPAVQPSGNPQTKSGEVFVIALPRIVVDVDQQGNLSIGSLALADLATLLGQNPAAFKIDKSYVDRVLAAGIQNVELRQTGDRLAPFVNAKPLPYIAWTDESLQQAADLAGIFNVSGTNLLRQGLPILRRLGLDVAVRFPRGSSAEIPLADLTTTSSGSATNEPASVVAHFEIKYDNQGIPAILGISAADLAALGLSLPLGLEPSLIQKLQAQNIQNIELNVKSSGLTIYANGNPLPGLAWDPATLANAVDLYSGMEQTSPYPQLLKMAMPIISNPDVAILVHFPLAAGAQPIPAKMH
jgi:hypothetical protein